MQCRKLLEHRTRLLSGKESKTSDTHHSGMKSSNPVVKEYDPPAQPCRPAPTLPPQKDKKDKTKESTKRRPAPSAPVSNAKQTATETKGPFTKMENN